jgi:hypothetical protein
MIALTGFDTSVAESSRSLKSVVFLTEVPLRQQRERACSAQKITPETGASRAISWRA